MSNDQAINSLQAQLANHRNHLAILLEQLAIHGRAYAPPATISGIAEARREIARIKKDLRAFGLEVEDLPDDEPRPEEKAMPQRVQQRAWLSFGQRDEVIAPEVDRNNRRVLINDMRQRFKERLETIPEIITLHFAERASAVERPGELIRPYDLASRRPGRNDEILPASVRLIDVYDQHRGQVLILGAPGAGKTFLLYELAHELVERAAVDDAAPVPVIFSLAAWQPGQTLQTWMSDDLAKRYNIKSQRIARLMTSGVILPLLDGLDEVDTQQRREQCVAAINAYRAEQKSLSTPYVVTCREREYQDLPALTLNGAIVVQPLTVAQRNRYLTGAVFAPLRQALSNDTALAELARIPLLLGIMAETYRDRAPQLPPDADESTVRQIILNDYVMYCCEPRTDQTVLKAPVNELRAFAAWLARGMIGHNNQQEFYLEFLQPTWLRSLWWHWGWRGLNGLVAFLVFAMLIGGLAGVAAALVYGLQGGLAVGVILGLLGGLLVGLNTMIKPNLGEITLVEKVRWSSKQITSDIWLRILAGFIVGILLGSIAWYITGISDWFIAALIGGPAMTLLTMLFDGFVGGQMEERRTPNQAMKHSLHSAATSGLLLSLIMGMFGAVTLGLLSGIVGEAVLGVALTVLDGIILGAFLGVLAGLMYGVYLYGGIAIIQHYTLRFLLAISTPAPLRLVSWLEEARMRGLLVRVGGGYRFYHELLQRHFAAHQEPGFAHVPTIAELRCKDDI